MKQHRSLPRAPFTTWVEYAEALSEPCPATGCWVWTGSKALRPNAGSFGSLARQILSERLGRLLARHEYACHRCDVAGCVNPDHVYLGTAYANSRDRWRITPFLRRAPRRAA